MKRLILALLVVFTVAACDWPTHGRGGMDEAFQYSRYTAYAKTPEANPYALHISRRVDIAKIHLKKLSDLGAEEHQPADLHTAKILWNRIARAFAAGMYVEAGQDLADLEVGIEKLKKQIKATMRGQLNQEKEI